ASALDGVVAAYNSAATGGADVTEHPIFLDQNGGMQVGASITPGSYGINFGQIAPVPALAEDSSVYNESDYFDVVTNCVCAYINPFSRVVLRLTQIADLSSGTGWAPDGGLYFTAGENYTFVILGDPTAEPINYPDGGPDSAYTGFGVHVLAYPNDMVAPAF